MTGIFFFCNFSIGRMLEGASLFYYGDFLCPAARGGADRCLCGFVLEGMDVVLRFAVI